MCVSTRTCLLDTRAHIGIFTIVYANSSNANTGMQNLGLFAPPWHFILSSQSFQEDKTVCK